MSNENKKESRWVLRKPFNEDALRTAVALAESGSKDKQNAHYACERILKEIAYDENETLAYGHVRTEREIQDTLNAIWDKGDEFNMLPTVAQIVEALVRAEPTFPAYAAMNAEPGSKLKKSNTKVYTKGTSFMSHTRERLGTLAKTNRSWTELTMWLNGNGKTYQKSVVEQLLSPKFVCAGTLMSPERPCPHGCTVMDNKDGKRDLKDFQLDHVIGFNYLPAIWTSILEEIHKSYKPNKHEGARMIARSFMRHLVFGTTKQTSYDWPPAVYARCGQCNLEGNTEAGGSTHPRVWEPVPEQTDDADAKWIWQQKHMNYASMLGMDPPSGVIEFKDPAGGSPKDPVAVKRMTIGEANGIIISQETYDAIIGPQLHLIKSREKGITTPASSE